MCDFIFGNRFFAGRNGNAVNRRRRNGNSAASAGDIENNSGFVHGDHGNKHVGLDYIIKKVPNQISIKAD